MKLCYFNHMTKEGDVYIIELPKDNYKIFQHGDGTTTCKLCNIYGKDYIPLRMRNDQATEADFQHTYPNYLNTERFGYYWMLCDAKTDDAAKNIFMSAVKDQINKSRAEAQRRMDYLNNLYTKASMIESGEMNLDTIEVDGEIER